MPHSSGGDSFFGSNLPIFSARATRVRDGKTFLIGYHQLGVTVNGVTNNTATKRGEFVYGMSSSYFEQKGDKLVLDNGSYIICTNKNRLNSTTKHYTTEFKAVCFNGETYKSGEIYNDNFTYQYKSNPDIFYNYLTQSVLGAVSNFHGEFSGFNSFLEYMQKVVNGEITTTLLNAFGSTPYIYDKPSLKPTDTDYWQNGTIFFGTGGTTPYSVVSNAQKELNFWGANNGVLPDTVDTVYDDDISKPNIPDSNYPDITNSDNTNFERTDDLISVSDLGAIHLYSPTYGQMNEFHSYLWSTDFLQNWDAQLKKLFGSPEQQIIALLAIYADIPLNSGTTSITLGNISSNVESATISKQYITIDCGEVDVPRIWGNFLDFEPYTTISIYLPFISTVDLTANEIVGKKLQLKYNIDVLTGACVAQLRAIDEKRENVILNVSGNCGVQIPWNSANYNQLVSNAITAVAGLGATVLSGGLAPVIASGSIANAVGELAQIGVDTADNVFSGASPRFSRGGSFNTNNGVLCDKIPHLLITRPIQSFAQNYNKYNGYPSNITEKIGNLKGFTKIDKINLTGISATAEEIEQITTLLKSGIIIT